MTFPVYPIIKKFENTVVMDVYKLTTTMYLMFLKTVVRILQVVLAANEEIAKQVVGVLDIAA